MFDWDVSLRGIFNLVVFFVFVGMVVYGFGTTLYRARDMHVIIGLAGIFLALGTWFLILH